MGPVRLLAVLAALVALLAAAPLAGGAPGKRVRCRNAVTLKQGKHRGCLAKKRLNGPRLSAKAVRSRTAGVLTNHAYLKAELPKRVAPLAWKARGATRRTFAPLTRKAPAIPAADGGPVVVEPMVTTLAPGDQAGGTIGQTAHTKLEGGGTATATSKATMQADECPNAQGDVPGRVGYTMGFKQTSGPIPGTHRFHGEASTSVGTTAKITAHVGDDGHIRDYDAVIDVDGTATANLVGPGGLSHGGGPWKRDWHLRFVLTGLKLGQRGNADQFGTLWDVRENGQGGQFSIKDGEVIVSDQAVNLARFGLLWTTQEATAVLQKSQSVFANGGCLTAHFAPALQLTGSPEILGVTVTDRAGKPVDIDLKGSAYGGTLASSTAHATPSQPALFTFRPTGSPSQAGVSVTGASRRGTVSGSTSATKPPAKAYMYTVDLSGTWSYSEHDSSQFPDSTTTSDYSVDSAGLAAHWSNAILRLDGGPTQSFPQGAQTVAASGSTTSHGSHTEEGNDASFTCGPADILAPSNPADTGILQSGTTLTFSGLLPFQSATTPKCSTTGSWYGTRSPSLGGAGSGDLFHVTAAPSVSIATMRQPTFTVPVTVTGFPAACAAVGSNTANSTCTHTLSLAATATFHRLYPCVPTGGGGYGCGTSYGAARRSAN